MPTSIGQLHEAMNAALAAKHPEGGWVLENIIGLGGGEYEILYRLRDRKRSLILRPPQDTADTNAGPPARRP